ncbi:multidrug resistance efflux transporter family protein [Lysinibacillus agricola]|uniref:multidrug resistance efflux transporter family protein n=1 Tax=Lysinibacillus agricola TaxID=2590012 RepID=UPI003C1E7CE3
MELCSICLFYAPAAAFAPGWLISGTWKFTIVSWVLLAPALFQYLLGKQYAKFLLIFHASY